jgi:outer membrane biosynthesis protein TonB
VTRREISPALIGSAALHLAVAAALLISWRFERDLKVGTVTPVTIVANAPATDLKAAEQAPVEQHAQVEAPDPEAQPEPVPPAPQPTPKPAPAPAPKPAPAPAPKPAPAPAPRPAKPAEKPERSLDLDALAASLAKQAKTAAKPSSAAKGPPRPETAAQARQARGSGSAAASLNGLTDDLQRRWNPNCDVAGARDVEVWVTFTLGLSGQLVGNLNSEATGPEPSVNAAATVRARSAVRAAAPFRNLPRELYGQPIRVHFDAKQACS